jgi:hypothetical protein
MVGGKAAAEARAVTAEPAAHGLGVAAFVDSLASSVMEVVAQHGKEHVAGRNADGCENENDRSPKDWPSASVVSVDAETECAVVADSDE